MPSTLRRPSVALALGICAIAAVSACDVSIRDGDMSVEMLTAQAKEEWTRHFPLAPGGIVEVVNLNGPIEVMAGPAGAVDVNAHITAKALTDAAAKDVLSKGKIEEQASPVHVKIETVVPRGIRRASYEVRYDVRVPADAETQLSTTNGSVKAAGLTRKLKASVVHGSLDVTHVEGEIDAACVNGSLTVKVTRISAPLRLETTNGRLSFELPASSRVNLSARVVNGRLNVSGLAVTNTTGNHIRTLQAALNGGGPTVDLRATNGRMTITGTGP